MTILNVTCINKTDRYNPWERISSVGGVANGRPWKHTQEEAVSAIEHRLISYFVSKAGQSVRVIVAVSAYGHKYIKTEADGEVPNNLLSLPECP